MPIAHPEPTRATVRELYGTALRCGRPGCAQLLYRTSEDTGKRVLNSRVAHIHARRENGPRWNPAMSGEKNQGYDNLILLCEQHAWEIDETPGDFPAELLRQWKQGQVALHEQAARSQVPLSDAEADEAARLSFSPAELASAVIGALPSFLRVRPREEALDLAARRSLARRAERLPVPRERLDAVLMWMAGQAGPVTEVPDGSVRVLVGPMGAGKSEIASLWWDEGLAIAQDNPETEIPVWFPPRQVIRLRGLEDALVQAIGHDPKRPCRVVIDGLDGVSPSEASQLLYEARQLVETWPQVAVLATSRPGLPLRKGEEVTVGPWSAERGLELVRLIVGDTGWNWRDPEAMDLLTSPLTALAVAARLLDGHDIRVSRLALLRGLPQAILRQHRPDKATPQLWAEMSRLAGDIISRSAPARAASFGNEALTWQLTDTGLVIENDGMLSFSLPLFEQHFGAQALTSGLVRFEAIADPVMFPRWRYAVAFAVSTSEPWQADDYMLRMARINPAAVSWILDEIAAGKNAAESHPRPAGAPPARRPGTADAAEPDPAIARTRLLRDALQALLEGFGSCRSDLVRQIEGQLVQWGAQPFGDQYLAVYEARDRLPLPDIVLVPGDTWENRLPDGWSSQTLYRYPADFLGRWTWARDRLERSLADAVQRRRLPLPPGSPLVAERLWALGLRVMQIGRKPHGPEIALADLREVLDGMLQRVNRTVRSTWRGGGEPVDSDDVRWMHSHLEQLTGKALHCPWPAADQPSPRHRWRWQGYSPELASTVVAGILSDAVHGYQNLVTENFASFGSTLGLYSVLPVRVTGAVQLPQDDVDGMHSGMMYELKPDHGPTGAAVTAVRLSLITDSGPGRYAHDVTAPVDRKQAPFYRPVAHNTWLPLGQLRPATNLAYQWLAADLHAVGWLSQAPRFDDLHRASA